MAHAPTTIPDLDTAVKNGLTRLAQFLDCRDKNRNHHRFASGAVTEPGFGVSYYPDSEIVGEDEERYTGTETLIVSFQTFGLVDRPELLGEVQDFLTARYGNEIEFLVTPSVEGLRPDLFEFCLQLSDPAEVAA